MSGMCMICGDVFEDDNLIPLSLTETPFKGLSSEWYVSTYKCLECERKDLNHLVCINDKLLMDNDPVLTSIWRD